MTGVKHGSNVVFGAKKNLRVQKNWADGVYIRYIKNLPPELLFLIAKVLTVVLRDGQIPSIWRHTRVVYIPKHGISYLGILTRFWLVAWPGVLRNMVFFIHANMVIDLGRV